MIRVIIVQKDACYASSSANAVYSADFFFMLCRRTPPCGCNISWVDISL